MTMRATYPALGASCTRARTDTSAYLRAAGCDGDTAHVAAQVVAELVANGITHHRVAPGERLGLRCAVGDGPLGIPWVTVAVRDAGRGVIGPSRPTDGAESGRGLILLRGLGVRLAGTPLAGGYEVTALFPLDPRLRAHVCGCDCARHARVEKDACRILVLPQGDPVDTAPTTLPGFEDWTICPPCLRALVLAALAEDLPARAAARYTPGGAR